jgi:hypothetical protein
MSSCLVNTARLTTNANRQLLIAFVIKRFYGNKNRNSKGIKVLQL